MSASPAVDATLEGEANGNWASWYASFAKVPLVLGYNPHSRFRRRAAHPTVVAARLRRVRGHASSPHLAILGASGAGKTSVLRCLAGLAGSRAGSVHLGGRRLSDVPTENRRLGYVPQEPTLLPHLNVWQQVCFGRGADLRLASYWIERLGLSVFTGRLPDELSGGQRQRVALARALCRSPQLVLLDEPFADLDTPVSHELRRELRAVQQGGGFASVLVTHDPEEAALLADEVVVIDGGRVLQAGRRAEVFAHPATPLVARLLGIGNISSGDITAPGIIEAHGLALSSPRLDISRRGHRCFGASTPSTYRCHPPIPVGAPPDSTRSCSTRSMLDRSPRCAWAPPASSCSPAPPTNVALGAGTPCVLEIPAEHVAVWAAADPAPVARTTPVM